MGASATSIQFQDLLQTGQNITADTLSRLNATASGVGPNSEF